MPRGYAPSRVDDNQKLIVDTMRQMGAKVLLLHTVGKGCPDVLVGYNKINMLVEIKDGSKPPSKQKLTEAELNFFNHWKGSACVISTVQQAIDLIMYLRKCYVVERVLS